jgi:UDP-glucose 4-epimerase
MRRVVFVLSNAAYHKCFRTRLVETDPALSIRDGNPAGHFDSFKMAFA